MEEIPMEKEVRRALRMMRKANTKENKIEHQLHKLQSAAEFATTKKCEKKKAASPEDNLFECGEPIILRTMSELHEKAKKNHHLAKELHNIEHKSSTLGKPKPLYVELIGEIKAEQDELLLKSKEQKRLEYLRRMEIKRREEQIASTIELLRKNKVSEGGVSDDVRANMLAKLAASRRVLKGDDSRPESPVDIKVHTVSSQYNISIDDSVQGAALPSGRIRPKTAGAVREISASDGAFASMTKGGFASYVKSLPEFNSSTECSSSAVDNMPSLTISVSNILGSSSGKAATGKRPASANNNNNNAAAPSNNNNNHNTSNINNSMQRQRASAWGAAAVVDKDSKLAKVLELRKRMEQQKEDEVIRRALEREQRHDRTQALKDRRVRQKAFLVIIKVMYWIELFKKNQRLQHLVGDRNRKMLIAKLASRTFAGIKLSRWWRRIKIWKLLMANPKAMFTLAYAVRFLWAKLRLRKMRSGALLLSKFLKDAYDKAYLMKRLYGFRKYCIKIQRWVRSWLRIQQARLYVLFLAMERIEQRREEEAKAAHFRELKLSVKAMSKLEGFAETVQQINTVQKRIHKLLDDEDKAMKKILREQQYAAFEEETVATPNQVHSSPSDRHAIVASSEPVHTVHGTATVAPPPDIAVNFESSMSDYDRSSIGSDSKSTSHEAFGIAMTAKKPPNVSSTAAMKESKQQRLEINRKKAAASEKSKPLQIMQLPMTWKQVTKTAFIRKMLASKASEHKLNILYDVLKTQRTRHMLHIEEANLRTKKSGSVVKVNKQGLQKFLKNPYSVDGIDLVFNGLTSGDFIKMRRLEEASECMFLLLTKGGIDSLENIPSSKYNLPEQKQ